jgi:hypothetical protein
MIQVRLLMAQIVSNDNHKVHGDFSPSGIVLQELYSFRSVSLK